jgi:hypothetical protein
LAIDGLSLLGFLNEAEALNYLRIARPEITPAPTDAALKMEWIAASNTLGSPPKNFGKPDIKPLVGPGATYVGSLRQQPWIAIAFQAPIYHNATFQLIEIDPLLAYQFHVGIERAHFHCAKLSSPPTENELLELCLPMNIPSEQYQISVQDNSAIIRVRSLNLQLGARGSLNAPQNTAFGITLNLSLPLVHITKFNDRYYLHNGYHRVYGAKKAGATHIPAILRETASAQDAGIRHDGGTFRQDLLESENPPTLAHFSPGIAHPIELKSLHRVITVSWSDHVVPDL